jgi:hypothetical protein
MVTEHDHIGQLLYLFDELVGVIINVTLDRDFEYRVRTYTVLSYVDHGIYESYYANYHNITPELKIRMYETK